jgi:hypothetical protein
VVCRCACACACACACVCVTVCVCLCVCGCVCMCVCGGGGGAAATPTSHGHGVQLDGVRHGGGRVSQAGACPLHPLLLDVLALARLGPHCKDTAQPQVATRSQQRSGHPTAPHNLTTHTSRWRPGGRGGGGRGKHTRGASALRTPSPPTQKQRKIKSKGTHQWPTCAAGPPRAASEPRSRWPRTRPAWHAGT